MNHIFSIFKLHREAITVIAKQKTFSFSGVKLDLLFCDFLKARNNNEKPTGRNIEYFKSNFPLKLRFTIQFRRSKRFESVVLNNILHTGKGRYKRYAVLAYVDISDFYSIYSNNK